MEKYYPPFYINYILEKPQKTEVKVTFSECSLVELKLASKEGRNTNGKVVKQEIFELPKMSADEARKTIYSKFEKEKVAKREIVPEREIKEL